MLDTFDARLDRRLVHTFRATIEALLTFWHRPQGLLLSELGGYLLPADHAPAGTKRLGNLLHSDKWDVASLEEYCWTQAQCQAAWLANRGLNRWRGGMRASGRSPRAGR